MRTRTVPVRSVVFVLVVTMLAVAPSLAGDDKSDLKGRAAAFQEAFNSGDFDAVAALYAENGMRLPYQAPTIEGRAAIASNLQANRDGGITKIELAVLGAETQGNMGWGHGTYRLMDAEGATVQQGKWMNVSKKVDGKWLIDCDIWNTDAP